MSQAAALSRSEQWKKKTLSIEKRLWLKLQNILPLEQHST